jgi:hypothetical protein
MPENWAKGNKKHLIQLAIGEAIIMGMSKKDLLRHTQNLRKKIEELEAKARMDPLRKNIALHDELDKLKKKLLENG